MEGSGLGSPGCVVHVNSVQVSCVMDCYNAIATEHGLLKSISYAVELYCCLTWQISCLRLFSVRDLFFVTGKVIGQGL